MFSAKHAEPEQFRGVSLGRKRASKLRRRRDQLVPMPSKPSLDVNGSLGSHAHRRLKPPPSPQTMCPSRSGCDLVGAATGSGSLARARSALPRAARGRSSVAPSFLRSRACPLIVDHHSYCPIVTRVFAAGCQWSLPVAMSVCSRWCEQGLSLAPKPPHEIGGRLGRSQTRRLSGPGLHAIDVAGLRCCIAHGL